MGSGDGMKELIEKLAAKIDDLKTSLDKLAPLAPVAEQLATLPSKVVALQSSAFENQEQVRALNLAILRAENAQREGRPHAEDNGNATGEGSINRARQGPVPPLENDRPPPRGLPGIGDDIWVRSNHLIVLYFYQDNHLFIYQVGSSQVGNCDVSASK
ncbi:hypothetical protein GUJ93_ZPchr0002g25606 [Zizania palustris]|uniref:Uncharacterized protein n=1 Tax=Zizania palustris TaxID=103762 RepID=A0A8J5RU71_ZIZPA|nr:hypothetical protein GUJ93_ZPchr0002g25606 [Zizania palustris]